MLEERAAMLGSKVSISEFRPDSRAEAGQLLVIPEPLAADAVCGEPDPANAASLLAGLRRAVERMSVRRFLGTRNRTAAEALDHRCRHFVLRVTPNTWPS